MNCTTLDMGVLVLSAVVSGRGLASGADERDGTWAMPAAMLLVLESESLVESMAMAPRS